MPEGNLAFGGDRELKRHLGTKSKELHALLYGLFSTASRRFIRLRV